VLVERPRSWGRVELGGVDAWTALKHIVQRWLGVLGEEWELGNDNCQEACEFFAIKPRYLTRATKVVMEVLAEKEQEKKIEAEGQWRLWQ